MLRPRSPSYPTSLTTALSLLSLIQSPLTTATNNIPSQESITTNTGVRDVVSFSCLPLTSQLSDPIVSPGQQSSHMHVVTGGTAFQRSMGEQTARNASETTCEVALDKSNYWIPALYHAAEDGSFEPIEYEWSVRISVSISLSLLVVADVEQAIYYLNRACNYAPDARKCRQGSYPLAPPAGLRMIAGNITLRYNIVRLPCD